MYHGKPYDGGDSHECVFEEPTDEYFDDGAFIVVYQCGHAPVLNSWTDHERDEIYTEHGPQCEITKYVRLDVSRFEVRHDDEWYTLGTSDENAFHDIYHDDDHRIDGVLIEEIEHAIATAVTDNSSTYAVEARPSCDSGVEMDRGYHERTITVDGEDCAEGFDATYRIYYDNVSEGID